MATRRLTIVAPAVAALVAVAAVLVISHSTTAVHEHAPLRMHAVLRPAQVEFGDAVTAQVVATIDAKNAGRVHIAQSLAPLTQLGEPRLRVVREGSLAVVVQTTEAACLTQACVSDSGTRTVTLPPARVTIGSSTSSLAWSQLTVRGRTTNAEVAASTTALRADASPPLVTYAISPALLAWLFGVAAALLAALAIAIFGREAARALNTRRRRADDPLARALLLARESEHRLPADRRVALDLLARVLHREPSTAIRDAAWSKEDPSPSAVSAIADDVERRLRK